MQSLSDLQLSSASRVTIKHYDPHNASPAVGCGGPGGGPVVARPLRSGGCCRPAAAHSSRFSSFPTRSHVSESAVTVSVLQIFG
jgi:hypothetical protein